MATPFVPIFALLLSVAILLMGNGLQGTLLPVRADMEAFTTFDVGVLGSAYFLGFAGGCVFGGRLIGRVGHIRAFAALVSIASTIALAHALWPEPAVWWVLRAATGFCFAALYMTIESWLNERATNETRGLIYSVYTMINLTVLTLGQLMVTLYDPAGYPLFLLASILASLAAVPVALTRAPAPAPVGEVRVRPRKLWRMSPAGFAGCLAVGLANGSFWALGPVFARQTGADIAGVAFFMSATVIGGAVGQWPLGRLSDRMDRRRVVVGVCLASVLAALAMIFVAGLVPGGLLVFGFLFGAFSFPVNAISIAHANDFAGREDYVEVASGLLLLYAVGAVFGPMIASAAMWVAGPEALFAWTALVHLVLAGFVATRLRARARAPEAERVQFAEALLATATVSPMDPLAEEAEEHAGAGAGAGDEVETGAASGAVRGAARG